MRIFRTKSYDNGWKGLIWLRNTAIKRNDFDLTDEW